MGDKEKGKFSASGFKCEFKYEKDEFKAECKSKEGGYSYPCDDLEKNISSDFKKMKIEDGKVKGNTCIIKKIKIKDEVDSFDKDQVVDSFEDALRGLGGVVEVAEVDEPVGFELPEM